MNICSAYSIMSVCTCRIQVCRTWSDCWVGGWLGGWVAGWVGTWNRSAPGRKLPCADFSIANWHVDSVRVNSSPWICARESVREFLCVNLCVNSLRVNRA